MQSKIIFILLLTTVLFYLPAQAQYAQDSTFKRCFVGSSLFMFFNFLPEEKPDFAQLNFGYRLTSRDVVSLEVKTWRYFESLGIPYGEERADPANNFPGSIREVGFALAYQRYWWKGLYTGIHVMNTWQSFRNEANVEIATGFQLFNTYRVGYHIKLLRNRFFLEPSLAVTHRPWHTEMPASFQVMDDEWPKFFFWEPGLHFGFNF
ncbi:MAG: hypothetical protein AAGJ82_11795 [Bacteroidota bacterium]